ncbi:AI-2E family transporter [Acetobacter conturbans]|uniref:AI-2E family transporter n=1 Tax=Acetobacter conturbans TaxID=1737472 RepID=A0ABX0K2T0_9PROT|nr:AI-2E family transporter [Acetobacter conturbans]NHN90062.1 AI-2E family transporter [Acetobacter conturbans]
MKTDTSVSDEKNGAVSATRPVLVALLASTLVLGAVWILTPFIPALIWAGTIAVTMWPMLLRLQARLRGSRKLAVFTTLFVAIVMFVLPFWLAISTVVKHINAFQQIVPYITSLKLPDLPYKIQTLPMVGAYLGKWWRHLQTMKPMEIVQQAIPQPDQIMHYLMSYAGSIGMLAVQFLLTLIILAVFLTNAEYLINVSRRFISTLAGDRGLDMLQLGVKTIRGVALGVTLTAIVESAVGGVGMYFTGVPWASILTAITFMACLLQAGPGITLFPAVIWVYFDRGIAQAAILLAITFLTIVIDNMLRPYLIRKQANIPLVLIMMGVIGGLAALGLAGIFIGPMLLSVTYTLIKQWIVTEERT